MKLPSISALIELHTKSTNELSTDLLEGTLIYKNINVPNSLNIGDTVFFRCYEHEFTMQDTQFVIVDPQSIIPNEVIYAYEHSETYEALSLSELNRFNAWAEQYQTETATPDQLKRMLEITKLVLNHSIHTAQLLIRANAIIKFLEEQKEEELLDD